MVVYEIKDPDAKSTAEAKLDQIIKNPTVEHPEIDANPTLRNHHPTNYYSISR